MTPDTFKKGRRILGLTQSELAATWEMGENGDRSVRRWEAGDVPVPGPVGVLLRWMVWDEPPELPLRSPPAPRERP